MCTPLTSGSTPLCFFCNLEIGLVLKVKCLLSALVQHCWIDQPVAYWKNLRTRTTVYLDLGFTIKVFFMTFSSANKLFASLHATSFWQLTKINSRLHIIISTRAGNILLCNIVLQTSEVEPSLLKRVIRPVDYLWRWFIDFNFRDMTQIHYNKRSTCGGAESCWVLLSQVQRWVSKPYWTNYLSDFWEK